MSCACANTSTISVPMRPAAPVINTRISRTLWQFACEILAQLGHPDARATGSNSIHRCSGGNVETLPIVTSPSAVGRLLRHDDRPQMDTLLIKNPHASRSRAVDMSSGVHFHTVRRAWLVDIHVVKEAAV